MEVAALVLGIVSLVGGIFGVTGVVGPVCAVLAIIFGVLGTKKNSEKKGLAKAGLIMGIISIALSIIITLACVACVGAAASAVANDPSFSELTDILNSL